MFIESIHHRIDNTSLTVKMLVIVTLLGSVIWLIHDHILSRNVEKLFNARVEEQLDILSRQGRMRFDQNLRKFKTLMTVFQTHPGLIQYLNQKIVTTEKHPQEQNISRYSLPPQWFPPRSVIRNLIRPRYALLINSRVQVEEIYHSWEVNIPHELVQPERFLIESSNNQVRLTEINNLPFIVISTSVKSRSGQTFQLMFANPIDDELLVSIQNTEQVKEMTVLIDREHGNSVIASSQPDVIKTGTTQKELEKDYVMAGKPFFDYGASDLNIRLTTLVPKNELSRDLHALLSYERRQYVIFALIYMLAAYLLGIFAVGRLNRVTSRIQQFSAEFSHKNMDTSIKGDQLYLLETQFHHLVTIIRDAHLDLKQTASQLELEKEEQSKLIQELEETHEQLVQSDKMASLGSLVAGVSHEINTPLGVSMTGISYIERETDLLWNKFQTGDITKKQLHDYLETNKMMAKSIIMSLGKANELIRSFKQVAVDQNSEVLRRFNLYDYVNDILLSLHSKLKPTHIITLNQVDKQIELHSYPGIFSQIFSNLIANSLLHGFDNKNNIDGTINITAREHNGKIDIHFSDDGMGMAEDLLPKIFDPFFTTKMGQGGSGLGMYITYNLVVQRLNGNIKAENSIHSGLNIHITVPQFTPIKKKDVLSSTYS